MSKGERERLQMADKKQSFWMSDEEYRLVTSKTPIPTVNLVILRKKKIWEVLLLIRKTGYAKGSWCFIGGRVWIGETLKDAIQRQTKDLGVKVKIFPPFNPNFPVFIDDKLGQDQTKQSVSIIYPAKIISGKLGDEGEEYQGYQWFPVNRLPKIAFDQNFEIQKTIEQLKNFNKNFMQELK